MTATAEVSPAESGRSLLSLPVRAFLPLTMAVPFGGAHTVWEIVVVALLLTYGGASRSTRMAAAAAAAAGAVITAGFVLSQSANGLPILPGVYAALQWAACLATVPYVLQLFEAWGARSVGTALVCLGLSVVALGLMTTHSTVISTLWKYGAGYGICLLVLSLLTFGSRTRAGYVVGIGLAVVSFALASRSLGGAVALAVVATLGHRLLGRGRKLGSVPLLAAGAVTALLLIPSLVSSEVFASSAQRFAEGAQYNDNLILAGRVEPPAELAAISVSPVWGFGLNGPVTGEVLSRALGIAQAWGYKTNGAMESWWFQGGTVYTHSLIASGWITGGLVVGLCGLAMWVLISLVFVTALVRSTEVALPLVSQLLWLQSGWDLLVSPPSVGTLSVVGFSLGLAVRFASVSMARPVRARPESLLPRP